MSPRSRKRDLDPRRSLLAQYRRRVILLERKIARLEASDPVKAQEQYIAALEARVIDVENRWEEAETECYELRQALLAQPANQSGGHLVGSMV
jgi:BMFP domain-containing protein YqiC